MAARWACARSSMAWPIRSEKFLGKKYVGTKRFGLDGGESMIPALEAVIKYGGALGVREIVYGMAHQIGKVPRQEICRHQALRPGWRREHDPGAGSRDQVWRRAGRARDRLWHGPSDRKSSSARNMSAPSASAWMAARA